MESTTGPTRSPNHVRASPTLAITVRLPDGTVSLMAGMSRAPPKPPLSRDTRGNVGSLLGVCGTALSTRMAAGFISPRFLALPVLRVQREPRRSADCILLPTVDG